MKKLFVAFILSLSLAGCGTLEQDIQTIKTNVQKIATVDNYDTITALYGSTLAVAVSYRRLCASKAIHKSCWKTIEKLQPYEARAYNAYKILKDFVQTNPNMDASALIKLAKDTIMAFKDAQITNGLK